MPSAIFWMGRAHAVPHIVAMIVITVTLNKLTGFELMMSYLYAGQILISTAIVLLE